MLDSLIHDIARQRQHVLVARADAHRARRNGRHRNARRRIASDWLTLLVGRAFRMRRARVSHDGQITCQIIAGHNRWVERA
jgi:hypothetical protein